MLDEFSDYPQAIIIDSAALTATQRNGSVCENFDPSNFIVERVSGIAASPTGVIESKFFSKLDLQQSIDEFAHSIGEWVALSAFRGETDHSYIVTNDQSGLSPLFYSLVPGRYVVVSDSFAAVAEALRDLEIQPELDLDYYLATISATQSQLVNPVMGRTFDYNIRELGVGEALLISSTDVTIFNRNALLTDLSEDWRRNVERGIQWTTTTLQRVAQAFGHHSLLLSGGVDSRMVLAMLLAGGVQDDFRLRVIDPRQYSRSYSRNIFSKDFVVSIRLAERYGLRPQAQTVTRKVPLSFGEALALSNRYGSAFSFAYKNQKYLAQRDEIEYSLRGGGGEILKGSGFSMWRNTLRSGNNLTSWLNEKVYSGAGSSEIVSFVQNYWAQLAGHGARDDLALTLYERFRHRTHFGHTRQSRLENEIPFQPLTNSFFIQASQQVELTDLNELTIPRAVFALADPSLLEIAFESDASTALLAPNSPTIDENSNLIDEYFAKLNKKKTALTTADRFGLINRSQNSDEDEMARYTKLAMESVAEAFPSVASLLRAAHKDVLNQIGNGELNQAFTVARSRSALDLIQPDMAVRAPIYLSTIPHRDETAPKPMKLQRGLVKRINGSSYIDHPPKLTISAQRKQSVITVEASVSSARDTELEFAFYLLAEGARKAHRKYSTQPRWQIQIPPGYENSRLSVKGFLRKTGALTPFTIIEVGLASESANEP